MAQTACVNPADPHSPFRTDRRAHRVTRRSDRKIVALDRALNLALVVYGDARKAQILDLKTRTVLKTFSGLPAKPKAVAIHPDTHVAVVASEDSNTLSLIDLQAQSITPNFAAAQRPKRLAISTRFNQALVVGDDMTELQTIQLPNPVPVLSRLVPPEADSSSLTVAALGERFIDGSRVNINGADLTTRWLDGQRLDADLPAALWSEGQGFTFYPMRG